MSVADLNRTASTSERLMLRLEIEEFLAHEAALLDDRKFREWLDVLDDDLEYWMPVRTTRAKGDEGNEFAKIGEGAFFDETKPLMEERIRKLETPYSWAFGLWPSLSLMKWKLPAILSSIVAGWPIIRIFG
jgi:3-phenylpropionate/cinnamic acid dioxygenase small subunit